MRVLLTGGCGFVGSHITEELVRYFKAEVVVLDRLTYAARLANVSESRLLGMSGKVDFVWHDFRYPLSEQTLQEIGSVDAIIHAGAESHATTSFAEPELFLESNTIGTLNMLEAARKLQPAKFLYVSTDEVFGPSHGQRFSEDSALHPTSPYSATKAGGELLAYSYYRSFGVPVVITHTMNLFGERQHVEKFIPMIVRKILRHERVDIHASQSGEVGSRNWLYVRNQANVLCFLLAFGTTGQKYNVEGDTKTNLAIAERAAEILGEKLDYQLCVPADRPFHDLNYGIDGDKIRKMGWKNPIGFDEGFEQTIKWYAEHPEYL